MMDNPANHDKRAASQATCVALDPNLVFTRREVGGRSMFIAHHPVIGKFFQLGPEEHRVASLLDGRRSLRQILAIIRADGISWTAQDVAEFISRLVSHKLASMVQPPAQPAGGPTKPEPTALAAGVQGRVNQPPGPEASASGSAEKKPEPTAPAVGVNRDVNQPPRPEASAFGSAAPIRFKRRLTRMLRWLSLLISQRIPLINGHRIAAKLEQRFGGVFSPVGMLCWAGLVVSGLIIVVSDLHEFTDELRHIFDHAMWLILIVMWIMAKVIHEAGHAIAARHHDVRVGKVGILFFFLAPLAFVDVTNAWKLRRRWQRVQIALGGVYLELAAAAIAAWVWCLLPDGFAKHLAAQFVLVAGPATLLVNANPLLRLDGYYVLSDLTEIPNLRMHGRRQLAALLEQWLLKGPPIKPLLSGWRYTFATVHAVCSCLFQAVWMAGLVIGVSTWAKGLGAIMGAAAIVLWVVLPLSRWSAKVWMSEPGGRWYLNGRRKRLLSLASLLLLVVQFLSTSHSPFARRVPVVVQFSNEQIARATAAAFVHDVYVTRGERVKAGQLLIVLEEPELLIERQEKADDLKIAELREVQFRKQGELSRSAAEAEKAASLTRQLAELDAQIAGLTVVAERAGVIVGSEINSLRGRFVNQGAELLRVSDPHEKELLVSVGEADVQAYQNAVELQVPATVRLRGGRRFTATPTTLRPRANRSLPHPALAATVGGPLAVEPSPEEDEQLRTIEPQLESVTPLDPLISTEIEVGQIGTMTIADNRSLVARVYSALLSRQR